VERLWADISIDDPTFRVVPPSYRTLAAGWSADHLDVVVRLQPGARPGRKTITVNGSRKTFDATFQGQREASKVIELKFVRKDGARRSPRSATESPFTSRRGSTFRRPNRNGRTRPQRSGGRECLLERGRPRWRPVR
jgi:hypothetical protein